MCVLLRWTNVKSNFYHSKQYKTYKMCYSKLVYAFEDLYQQLSRSFNIKSGEYYVTKEQINQNIYSHIFTQPLHHG